MEYYSIFKKKKWCTEIQYNIFKLWKYYVRWKKLITKILHVAWFHLHEMSGMPKSIETEDG